MKTLKKSDVTIEKVTLKLSADDELEYVKKYLTMAETSEEIVKKIFLYKASGRFVSTRVIGNRWYAYAFNHFDYNSEKLIKFLLKLRNNRGDATLKNNVNSFIVYVNKNFDIEEIKEEREANRKAFRESKNKKSKIDDFVADYGKLLTYFNMQPQTLVDKIASIKDGGKQSVEDYIKELYVLRELFLSKAKGELATTQTETLYEVEELSDGTVKKKKIYENSKGKKLVTVKTQSYLPDEKSLIALRVLDEMILQAETNNEVEVTEDELVSLYEKYKQEAEEQRKKALGFIEGDTLE